MAALFGTSHNRKIIKYGNSCTQLIQAQPVSEDKYEHTKPSQGHRSEEAEEMKTNHTKPMMD